MVDGLTDDMKSVTQLVQSQIKAGMKEDDVKETMCRSWDSRLQQQKGLRDSHKSALTDAISEGPWTEQQKKLLAATVLASGVTRSKKNVADRRPNQKAHNIESLLPVECMSNLKDTSKYSITSRLSILARSVKSLGIENPDNITLFRLICIVAYCDPKSAFTQEETWRHMTTLQKYIKAGGNSTVQYLVDYTPSSVLLPQDIQKSAYGSSGLPPDLDWREVDHILADQKARGDRTTGSSNAGKRKKGGPQHTPVEHESEQPLPSPETWRFQAGSKILPTQPTAETAAFGAKTYDAAGRSEQLCSHCGKALDDNHKHETPLDVPPVADAGVDGLDVFEQGMRQAADAKATVAKTRKQHAQTKLKRPAAASASLKRSAAANAPAAASASLKRPAAANASTGNPKKQCRTPVPGWSTARRLKTYPNGCSKCAGKTPGCTPSCFRARGEA